MNLLVVANFDSKVVDEMFFNFCDEELMTFILKHFPNHDAIEFAMMANPGKPHVRLIFERGLTQTAEIQAFAPELAKFVERRLENFGVEDKIMVSTFCLQSL